MKSTLNFLKKLYHDERGAEGLEKILIIAAVALPMLGLLIYFRNYLGEWLGTEVDTITNAEDIPQNF